jgi:hypothetical protein
VEERFCIVDVGTEEDMKVALLSSMDIEQRSQSPEDTRFQNSSGAAS